MGIPQRATSIHTYIATYIRTRIESIPTSVSVSCYDKQLKGYMKTTRMVKNIQGQIFGITETTKTKYSRQGTHMKILLVSC